MSDALLKTPRDYQKDAINAVVAGLKSEGKGQLILPCGAGKTLVALWIAQKLKAKKVLVLVPSLALLKQIKESWDKEGIRVARLCVCSEKDIGVDSESYSPSEIDSNATNNPLIVEDFVKNNKSFIIYSTYQSLDKIIKACTNLDSIFDLIVCDEAHRSAGSKDLTSKFARIHNEEIKAKHILFMTATPKIVTGYSKTSESNIFSMDDESLYGPVLYSMSFGDAINRGILVDYRVVGVTLSCEEIKKMGEDINVTSYLDLANNFALDKFMDEYNCSHVVAFHSSVKKSIDFKERHQKISAVPTFHVDGNQTSSDRQKTLSTFKNESRSVVSNSRCLTEGVDVPSIDAVYFCDPKNSKIDIIQAVGRALRHSDSKQKLMAYIVVPLFHSSKTAVEKKIKEGSFDNLISVLRALGSEEDSACAYEPNFYQDAERKLSSKKLILSGFTKDTTESEWIKDKICLELIQRLDYPGSIGKYSLEEASFLVKQYKFKSSKQYKLSLKECKISRKFPVCPDKCYKEEGWVSWASYLGTKRIHAKKRAALLPSYEVALSVARELGICSADQYRKYSDYGKFPCEMPVTPENFYKNKGWVDWPTFLGVKRKPECLSYCELKKIVQDANIQSTTEYNEFRINHPLKEAMPCSPTRFYTKHGQWISILDFFGISRYKTRKKDNARV